MHEQLKKYFDTFLTLSQSAADQIEKNFKVNRIGKGRFLVRPDLTVTEVHFIVKGSCRFFHKKNNRQITHWFEFENSFVTAFRGFTSDQLSSEYIQLLEDGLFLSIHRKDLLRIYSEYHEWERLGRLITEDFARRMINRVTTFQTLSATQRYLMLLENDPRIIQRIPLGYISSYLGISQETLSRIRSQIRQK